MAAGVEELAEIFAGLAGRIRRGDADTVDAEVLRFAGERALEIGGRKLRIQKSRST